MRIGLFTDTYPPFINGVSTSVLMLQKSLEQQGHQVYVVAVNPDNLSYQYENDDKIIRLPGIPIGIYNYRLTGIYPFRAIKKIRKWHLDVIHSHTEFGVGTFARIIANQFDIPLVHTYHTMYEDYVHYITKGYFDGPSKKIVEYLTKFYCDKTASELIVPTKKTYDLFVKKYKFHKNIHIIPTGIETDRFHKENIKKTDINKLKSKYNITNKDFVILYIGRLGKEKNIDFMLDAFRKLIKKNKHIKLLLVGSGPDEQYFQSLTAKYKIKDNVIFTGAVPYDEVPIYCQLSDVFFTASKTETQGLTVLEAMAASLPVVCIKDESFECVIDNLNGKVFKTKKECQQKMETLISDKSLISKLGDQARINAEMHSSKYFADKVLTVYQMAIDAKPNNIADKIKRTIKRGVTWKK